MSAVDSELMCGVLLLCGGQMAHSKWNERAEMKHAPSHSHGILLVSRVDRLIIQLFKASNL